MPGDDGLLNVPKELQGTWYTYPADDDKLETIKISQNKINDGYSSLELHKINVKFANEHLYSDMSKSYRNATKNWGMAQMIGKKIHNIDYLNVRTWMQGAGDGIYYGAHTENGQSVVVIGEGAGLWTNSVAWKTPQLAQQYKHKKFRDLFYQDDQ